MKKSILSNLSRICLFVILIMLAGFIQPGNSSKVHSESTDLCMKKVPFVVKFSGVHLKGHLCGETGIRRFHEINIDLISLPKDSHQFHKFATQNVAATGIWNWQ